MSDEAERFDAVIVGSGFGGSVMAYRLAKAGKRVCLLERGKAYPPGSFSRTPLELRNNFWNPSEKRYGLFNVWSFRRMAAVVSAGLGGGSLIYANVLIRKDDRWFADAMMPHGGRWPITRAILDPHYDAVERILRPTTYPAAYQRDNKTAAMRAAANRLGIAMTNGHGDPAKPQWYLPDLAITFNLPGQDPVPGRVFDEGANYHGAPRETCRLCGECDVGCNYGSKNTLDYTYLSLAKNECADIRPLTEVKAFKPESGRYRVTCFSHDVARKTKPGELPVGQTYDLVADKLILSAGTLGSTYLLLKMQSAFRNISAQLGKRFSGNGDLLTFVTRCKDASGNPVRLNASRAPVITSTFRFPDDEDIRGAGRGFYLQDAGYPLALDYVWEELDKSSISRALRFAWTFVKMRIGAAARGDIDRQLGDLVGESELSSTSMPMLGMGRDVADGQMSTRPDPKSGVPLLQLTWDDRRSRSYIRQALSRARAVAEAMGGRYSVNPLTVFFNNLITVHPLGGCPMGASIDDGVVGADGQVFNYRGLYVADGSIIPGAVGANPSFTIAALSDRIADCVLRDW